MIAKQISDPCIETLHQWFMKWRSPMSHIATVCVLFILGYWTWKHHLHLQQLFEGLTLTKLLMLVCLLTLSIVLSALSFTLLVRCMGYRFAYQDGYHNLNLSQIAAMLPGKIWGLTGLAGVLWSHGISKQDSVLIIFLYTTLTLSAAILVGLVALISTIGWGFTTLCLLPVLLLLIGRKWLEALRSRYFSGSSSLPAPLPLLVSFIIALLSWITVSACFLYFVYGMEQRWPNSPLLVASVFAAAYIGGFMSILTPAGLGVREGIITLLLGTTLGHEEAFTAAVGFRILHTAVLWSHVVLTLIFLTFNTQIERKRTR